MKDNQKTKDLTAKEKADEIFSSVLYVMSLPQAPINENKEFAIKLCCGIIINEIIDALDWHELEYPNKQVDFWNEVLQEINKKNI